jgi:hypothetical protein
MRNRLLFLYLLFSLAVVQNYSFIFDGSDDCVDMGDMIDQSISFSITKGVLL